VTSFLVASSSVTLKDPELPKITGFIFFAIFGCASHFKVNCDEMAGYRLRQFANRNCYRLSRIS